MFTREDCKNWSNDEIQRTAMITLHFKRAAEQEAAVEAAKLVVLEAEWASRLLKPKVAI